MFVIIYKKQRNTAWIKWWTENGPYQSQSQSIPQRNENNMNHHHNQHHDEQKQHQLPTYNNDNNEFKANNNNNNNTGSNYYGADTYWNNDDAHNNTQQQHPRGRGGGGGGGGQRPYYNSDPNTLLFVAGFPRGCDYMAVLKDIENEFDVQFANFYPPALKFTHIGKNGYLSPLKTATVEMANKLIKVGRIYPKRYPNIDLAVRRYEQIPPINKQQSNEYNDQRRIGYNNNYNNNNNNFGGGRGGYNNYSSRGGGGGGGGGRGAMSGMRGGRGGYNNFSPQNRSYYQQNQRSSSYNEIY